MSLDEIERVVPSALAEILNLESSRDIVVRLDDSD